MDASSLHALARALSGHHAERDAIRPMLGMVIAATGLQCAYAARVDEDQDRFTVQVSQHTGADGVVVPEDYETAWRDTLCRQVLDAGMTYTAEAAALPASAAASGFAIQTYISQPIRGRAGAVVGTLCAVSRERVLVPARALAMMELFAELLALQIEQDRAVREAGEAFEAGSAQALAAAMDRTDDRPGLEQHLRGVFRLSSWDMRL